MTTTTKYEKPFLKWAGGKYRILENILEALPSGTRLIEPFVGSGVVFLNSTLKYKDILVGDSNPDLINLYTFIKNEGSTFIDELEVYFDGSHFNETSYYLNRERFNKSTDLRTRALLFVYLNRHCFNGLCRYNSSGGFNVPFGKYKTVYFPKDELLNFHRKSQNVTFKCLDFISLLSEAKTGDVVYMDPPYVPLTATANFSAYSSDGGFGLDQQVLLANIAEKLLKQGIHVVISNHDTVVSRDLYRNATRIESLLVSRMISGNGNRGKAAELIAIY